jgi:UDP-N-acetylmuramoyl-tripeptide--D-alanyl-D-alanine ligase
MELTADQIARETGGEVVAGDAQASATSFVIDSRRAEAGACFVALVGTRDGHDFVEHAFEHGATVALVHRDVGPVPHGRAVVRVADPLAALSRLGMHARERLHGSIVVGITGSTGKTGTKDLTAAALARKFRVHASPESFNNEAGVPLSLLGAPESTEAVALEMGARAHGDIAALCEIARPTTGVITNIGLAHAGLLGGRAGVARVKGELLESLDADAIAVLDADDPATPGLMARTIARVVLVSPTGQSDAEVRVRNVEVDVELRPCFVIESPWGAGEIRLELRGLHQVANASLAATVALAHGVSFDDVAGALTSVGPAPSRMHVSRTGSGLLVLDDAYNANPTSMVAALRALAHVHVSGPRVAVLGDMRELGESSAAEHAAIGDLVAELGLDALVTVGEEVGPLTEHARAGGVPTIEAADVAAAIQATGSLVGSGGAVLVKASRAIGLEAVAEAMRERAA